jgi:RNA recognition motif-containing protein
MKKKIFVGNLSWKVTEDILRPVFEKIGKVVSVKIITDQYTGKSKGFGFVEMENSEDADRAIRELNETAVLDRNIRVSLAQERSERSGNREPRESHGGGRSDSGRSDGRSGGFRSKAPNANM